MAELILFNEEQREQRAAKYTDVRSTPTSSLAFTCARGTGRLMLSSNLVARSGVARHHEVDLACSHAQELAPHGGDGHWLRRRSTALPASESDDSMLTPISSTGMLCRSWIVHKAARRVSSALGLCECYCTEELLAAERVLAGPCSAKHCSWR